jgi:hypothetical protein
MQKPKVDLMMPLLLPHTFGGHDEEAKLDMGDVDGKIHVETPTTILFHYGCKVAVVSCVGELTKSLAEEKSFSRYLISAFTTVVAPWPYF